MARIVTAQRAFVADVEPAVARRIIREGQGAAISQDPFTVALREGLTGLPSLAWGTGDSVHTPNTTPGLTPPAQPQSRIPRAAGGILSNSAWKEQFRDTDEVWVQNLGSFFISLDVELGQGQTQHVRIPRMRDPYRLSDDVTTPYLRASNNFARMLAKRERGRPMIKVMTSAEAEAWYAQKARDQGIFIPGTVEPDVVAAYEASRQKYRDLTTVPTSEQGPGGFDSTQQFAPPKSVQELVSADMGRHGYAAADPSLAGEAAARREYDMANLGRAAVMVRDVVDPRVLHLCNQVANDVPPHQLLDAQTLLDELRAMEGRLTEDSLQHVVSHGRYKSVKAWANEQLARVAQQHEIDDVRPQTASASPPRRPPYEGGGLGLGAAAMRGDYDATSPSENVHTGMVVPPSAGVEAVTYQGPGGFAPGFGPKGMPTAGGGGGAIVGPNGERY